MFSQKAEREKSVRKSFKCRGTTHRVQSLTALTACTKGAQGGGEEDRTPKPSFIKRQILWGTEYSEFCSTVLSDLPVPV